MSQQNSQQQTSGNTGQQPSYSSTVLNETPTTTAAAPSTQAQQADNTQEGSGRTLGTTGGQADPGPLPTGWIPVVRNGQQRWKCAYGHGWAEVTTRPIQPAPRKSGSAYDWDQFKASADAAKGGRS